MSPPVLGSDFRRLWQAYAVSAAGSAIAAGALPLVAVLVLDASAMEVSVLAALSAATGALSVLPMSHRIDRHRKRPVMIAADLVRFAVLASVPAAAVLDRLTFAHLYAAATVQAAAAIVFTAASEAHLKALVAAELRGEANSRFESTNWLAQSVGPPVGGALVAAFGATATILVDAVSFLLSALGIQRVRQPETAVPAPAHTTAVRRDAVAGWTYILSHAQLRPLFWNAMLFGGAVMWCTPLIAVFMLRDLDLNPWQYGLAFGLPCLGGIAGARLMPRFTRRLGERGTLLLFGVLRTPWLLVLPLASPGTPGLLLVIAADVALLFAAGVFNPAFVTFRMDITQDRLMARVVSAWLISSRSVQPLFMVAGGLLAAATSVRHALAVGGALCLVSALCLPWRTARPLPGAEAFEEGARRTDVQPRSRFSAV
ncbi:MFS transporter [Catellatospora sp. TT07R-123]|uniref:MFS transporter n=1 Tax=Catellatospora sp. TT07R-123 TaxID=2733863 RepID=UPI001BB2FB94|nr:MFS transporter [Catellatospora sp. TT07R-123]